MKSPFRRLLAAAIVAAALAGCATTDRPEGWFAYVDRMTALSSGD